MGVVRPVSPNQLLESATAGPAGPSPPAGNNMITEGGDNMITESGDQMITET